MLGLANAFSNKNDQSGCGMLRTCCPLLSVKDISIAQQTLNSGGRDQHGFMNTFRQPQFNQSPPPPQRQIAPIHSPIPQMQAMSNYPALPLPVMPQQSYPMLASTIQYGSSSNIYQPNPSQINFNNNNNNNNRQFNRKSLDRNPYALNSFNSNNLQSKSSYTHLLNQFSQSTIYAGKCGLKPTQFNQARVQNLHYPASSTEFAEFPWQGALLKRIGPQDSLFVCGATLISDQWILVAAHCIKKNTALDLKIRLGEWYVYANI